jgi:hypothetical protein
MKQSRNAKHGENKHRAEISEANELRDRPSERVRVEKALNDLEKKSISKKKTKTLNQNIPPQDST